MFPEYSYYFMFIPLSPSYGFALPSLYQMSNSSNTFEISFFLRRWLIHRMVDGALSFTCDFQIKREWGSIIFENLKNDNWGLNILQNSFIRPKENKALFPAHRVTKINLMREAAKIFFFGKS